MFTYQLTEYRPVVYQFWERELSKDTQLKRPGASDYIVHGRSHHGFAYDYEMSFGMYFF